MDGNNGLKRQTIAIFLICLLITLSVSVVYYDTLLQQSKKDMENIRAIYTERTERLINDAFHKTDILATVVQLGNGQLHPDTFFNIAQTLYKQGSGIRAIQCLPGGTVSFCYPIAGNEQALGNNIFQNPERKRDAQRAIDTKSIALSGPYALTQGGFGVVARNPIFFKDGSGNEYFWGFSVVILDLPQALEAAGLDHLADDGYRFQLFCLNENGDRIVISGDPDMDTDSAECGSIAVPNHEWTLAIRAISPWIFLLRAGIMLLIGFLLSALLAHQYQVTNLKNENRAKNLFLSNMSHDMRTPLNAVIGFARLGTYSHSLSEMKEYHQKIYESAQYLLTIVTNLLEIRNGLYAEIPLENAPCQAYMIADTASVMTFSQEKAGKLICQTENLIPNDLWVMLDAAKATRICTNLLDNAVKFTPEGGKVCLKAEWLMKAGDAGELTFSIQDNGPGIDKKYQKRMFIPFEQEHPERFEGTSGVGMGLSLAQQYAHLMGGDIHCISKPGLGSRFVVRLPAKRVKNPENMERIALPQEDALRGCNILIVEDNKINLAIEKKILEQFGASTDSAENGALAVERFSASPIGFYDILLMDLMMPVMDGLSAARTIRSLPRSDAKQLPILAVSANAFPDDIKACLEAGMNDHISKPIDINLLFETLKRWYPPHPDYVPERRGSGMECGDERLH